MKDSKPNKKIDIIDVAVRALLLVICLFVAYWAHGDERDVSVGIYADVIKESKAPKKKAEKKVDYYTAPVTAPVGVAPKAQGTIEDKPTRVTNREVTEVVRKGENYVHSPLPSHGSNSSNLEGGVSARQRVINARTAGPNSMAESIARNPHVNGSRGASAAPQGYGGLNFTSGE